MPRSHKYTRKVFKKGRWYYYYDAGDGYEFETDNEAYGDAKQRLVKGLNNGLEMTNDRRDYTSSLGAKAGKEYASKVLDKSYANGTWIKAKAVGAAYIDSIVMDRKRSTVSYNYYKKPARVVSDTDKNSANKTKHK